MTTSPAKRLRHNTLIPALLVAISIGVGAFALSSGFLKPALAASQLIFQDCDECPEMVVIPPGRFQMGFNGGEPERYEGPVQEITIEREFAAGRTEVTVAQYAAFTTATGYQAGRGCLAWDGVAATLVETANWADPGYGRPVHPDEPAVCLSWTDANAYVEWLAKKTGQPYQLLSEAQWEYAADSGSTSVFPWGDDPSAACKFANVFDLDAADAKAGSPIAPVSCRDGSAEVARVGSFQPNEFGLYDMVGNVWEWTADCYVMPRPAKPANESPVVTKECDRRSVKGGSWITRIDRQRPTFRGRDEEQLVSQIFGFRVGKAM
jgi:formylglycine-generating enzyme required for sulfatase activity